MLFFLIFIWRNNQQSLFNILGSMNQAVLFNSINNCALIMPFVVTERVVLYREKFAGMYSPWAYSFAQVLVVHNYNHLFNINCMILTSWNLLWFFFSGSHWDPLCIHPSAVVHNPRIPNYWLLLVSLQIPMVLVHHVLLHSQFCLPWDASCFIDSKSSNGHHIIIFLLSKFHSFLWFHTLRPSKSNKLSLFFVS